MFYPKRKSGEKMRAVERYLRQIKSTIGKELIKLKEIISCSAHEKQDLEKSMQDHKYDKQNLEIVMQIN